MSSAITTVGQTRINQLRGAEQPLIINRMVLALIPGLDSTLVVDRSQQMPVVGQIVHTATIDADNKGYVDPDQVVYSIVLGSDVGDFSFNWIGLVEAVTDNIISITTTPETPKRKTNLANNTTGNNITRNFMIQFQDAQNLTGIAVAASTWQFDYQADFTSHMEKIVIPTQAGTEKKHVTDSQSKKWEDHANDPHEFAPLSHVDTVVIPSQAGTAKKHVTDSQAKKWENHADDPHEYVRSISGVDLDNTDPLNPIIPLGTTGKYGLMAPSFGLSQVENEVAGSIAVTPAILKAFLSKRSFAANDYIRIPDVDGGLIIQFGSFSTGSIGDNATGNHSFPIAFAHSCSLVVTGGAGGQASGGGTSEGFHANSWTTTYFNWSSNWENRNDAYGPITYIAIGY